MRIYSAANGDLLHQIPKCHRGHVTNIVVRKEFIFTAGDDGAMRVWSSRSYELVTQFSEHSKGITGGPPFPHCQLSLCTHVVTMCSFIAGLVADNVHPHLVHTCSTDRMVITYDLKTGRRANYKSHKDGAFTEMCQVRDGLGS